MTIFNVIKYPISIPPKDGELEYLPTQLFRDWMSHPNNSWKYGSSAAQVERWMKNYWKYMAEEIISDLTLLRKMIQEYDEPI